MALNQYYQVCLFTWILDDLLRLAVFTCKLNYLTLMAGVAIGCGWQAVVAYVNLAAYYCVGLPIGMVLGFKTDMGVKVMTD